jgi:hypothetical protein
MAFSAENQSISGDPSGLPLFSQCWQASFLHKFMPILSVEICLRLGPLHAVFASASGLLSHDPLHR